MARIIVVPATELEQYLTPEEMQRGLPCKLVIPTKIRGAKGERGIRMFEGIPCDDSQCNKSETAYMHGDEVEYKDDIYTVNRIRSSKMWMTVIDSNGNENWVRAGNLKPSKLVERPTSKVKEEKVLATA